MRKQSTPHHMRPTVASLAFFYKSYCTRQTPRSQNPTSKSRPQTKLDHANHRHPTSTNAHSHGLHPTSRTHPCAGPRGRRTPELDLKSQISESNFKIQAPNQTRSRKPSTPNIIYYSPRTDATIDNSITRDNQYPTYARNHHPHPSFRTPKPKMVEPRFT
jgi:hypothetical protein